MEYHVFSQKNDWSPGAAADPIVCRSGLVIKNQQYFIKQRMGGKLN